jgi:hypothetical protein
MWLKNLHLSEANVYKVFEEYVKQVELKQFDDISAEVKYEHILM